MSLPKSLLEWVHQCIRAKQPPPPVVLPPAPPADPAPEPLPAWIQGWEDYLTALDRRQRARWIA